ncbi:MAG: hypothetical protein EAX90_03215 [Candidatus Heimdallarchaeota archaeon]|nr:hypothetical protein [Candidatus Heimdallarchaeota archaeon]
MVVMDEEIILKEIVEDFINILEKGDVENFKNLWHPKALKFGLGNTNELMVMNKDEMIKFALEGIQGLRKQIPNQEMIRFQIDEIIRIQLIENIAASVEVKWHMILPGSKGNHHSFIQFAKDNKKWFIINILEKGFEEAL